jgi:hypothetical protein
LTESHGGINILSGAEEISCLVQGYQVRKVKYYTTWFAGNTTITDFSEVVIFVNPILFAICTSIFSK